MSGVRTLVREAGKPPALTISHQGTVGPPGVARPVTIDEVAAAAGVSTKTVSRVIQESGSVSAATRARVQKAAAELDYHPNMAARSLAQGRSFMLGLIHGNPCANYVIELQHGSLARLRGDRWRLVIIPDEDATTLAERVGSIVRHAGLDGLVLTSPLCDSPEVCENLLATRIPFVRVSPDDSVYPGTAPSVGADDRTAAGDIAEHLIQLGHRRIGMVLGPPTHAARRERLAGFRDALQAASIPFDSSLMEEGLFTFESGWLAGHSLLRRARRPTAIFAQNDDMAAGVIVAAREQGLDVPGQVSVAGFDDSASARLIWPGLTTSRQPIREMAHVATDFLIRMLESRTHPIEHRRWPCKLIVRGSTGPAPAAR